MQQSLDELALRAAEDDAAREQLIHSQERNILAVASKVTHRYVTRNDDEWSVALYAFSRAIDTYRADDGSFSHYAAVVIRRRLVDHYRENARHGREINVPPAVFEFSAEEAERQPEVQYAVVKSSVRAADTQLRDEILAVGEALSGFGFGFFELTDCSPRQGRTRRECARAVHWLLESPGAAEQLLRTGMLPAQTLRQDAGVSKKCLERYRKYIIAAVVILAGDYPGLSEYLKEIGKEAGV